MKKLFLLFTLLGFLVYSPGTFANADSLNTGSPVISGKDTLFNIYTRIGPFTPEERANAVAVKLGKAFKNHDFDIDSIYIAESEFSTDVMFSDQILVSATYADAMAFGKTRKEVAQHYYTAIVNHALALKHQQPWQEYFIEAGLTLLALAFIAGLIKLNNRAFAAIKLKLISSRHTVMKGFRINGYELLSAPKELVLMLQLHKVLRWAVIGLICYLALPIIFSIFPWTEGYSDQLLAFVLQPVKNIFYGIIHYIPNLLTIAVIMAFTYYVVKFLRFISDEIDKGALSIPGFYADWAKPSFNIIRILLYAFTFTVIFPYLPGSGSDVFKGVSVFLGILFSLGSSSAISNIVAGTVITYMRPFKVGQRVKIGDVTGDIMEKTLLVTKIRTIKNEDITIPNAQVLSSHTVNYSTMAQEGGLILHATVTIGYDVPWRKVHQVLKEAALLTEGTLKAQEPFVLQTSLDDFYVSYQVNCYTDQPNRMSQVYSSLFQNIQDKFNEAGIEIMSPHYQALRDGNMTTIPENYLSKGYQVPPFRTQEVQPQEAQQTVKV